MTTIDLTKSIHLHLAHKGGVGKTIVASLVSEWLMNQGHAPIVFDADVKNVDACISNYQALQARKLPLMTVGEDGIERINEAGMEQFLESVLSEEGPHQLDSGANFYTPVMSYIPEMGLVDELKSAGKTVFIHAIVAGGDMTEETVKGLEEIAAALPWPLILWLNEFRSPAKLQGGVHFLESSVYVKLASRIQGIVRMKEVTAVQRDALNEIGPLHLLRSEVKATAGLSAQKRIAFGQWAGAAFAGLDVAFGVVAAKAA